MTYALNKEIMVAALISLTATLSACGGGGGSDNVSGDTGSGTLREPEVVTPTPTDAGLSGRAVDGYLRNATVWLDLNENFLPDTNEPSTQSGDGGRFSFSLADLTGIDNPQQYPLMVHAVAGVTVDEDLMVAGDPNSGVIQRPFFLTAPAGTTVVTPLTTLVRFELDALKQDSSVSEAGKTVASAHDLLRTRTGLSLNLMEDYIATPNGKLHAFAKGLVATLQLNLEVIDSDPTAGLTSLNGEGIRRMGRALLAESRSVLEFVELKVGANPTSQVAAETNFLENFSIPILLEGLINPSVIHRVHWYVSPNTFGNGTAQTFAWTEDSLPRDALKRMAEVTNAYSVTNKITSTSIDGWLAVDFHADRWQGATPQASFTEDFPIESVDGQADFRIDHTFKYTRTASSGFAQLNPDEAPAALAALAQTPASYIYNAQGMLDSVTYRTPNGSQSKYFKYLSDGKLDSVTITPRTENADESEVLKFSYDAEGREAAVSQYAVPNRELVTAQSGIFPPIFFQDIDAYPVLAATTFSFQDNLKSACTITSSTTDSDWCWYSEYEGNQLKYRYLELVTHGEPFLGRQQGGAIVAIAEFEYQSLLSIAR